MHRDPCVVDVRRPLGIYGQVRMQWMHGDPWVYMARCGCSGCMETPGYIWPGADAVDAWRPLGIYGQVRMQWMHGDPWVYMARCGCSGCMETPGYI